jgi:hypothetical protein
LAVHIVSADAVMIRSTFAAVGGEPIADQKQLVLRLFL